MSNTQESTGVLRVYLPKFKARAGYDDEEESAYVELFDLTEDDAKQLQGELAGMLFDMKGLS